MGELFSALKPLYHRCNTASLSLLRRYFHGKCTDAFHAFVPPLQTFIARTTSKESNHLYFLRISFVRKFHSVPLPQRTATNALNTTNLSSSINPQSQSILLIPIIFTSFYFHLRSFNTHSVNLYHEWLLRLELSEI